MSDNHVFKISSTVVKGGTTVLEAIVAREKDAEKITNMLNEGSDGSMYYSMCKVENRQTEKCRECEKVTFPLLLNYS